MSTVKMRQLNNNPSIVTCICAFAPNATTQLYQTVELVAGSTIRDAIKHLGWDKQFPQIFEYEVGVFAKKLTWDSPITMGDRVENRIEIYRPLIIEPMQRRQLKKRALAKKTAKNSAVKQS